MRIEMLSDTPSVRLHLARWYADEWSHLYEGYSLERALAELRRNAGRGTVPTTLVALDGDEPIGTVSLIEDDLPGYRHLTPWLASFYVRPDRRDRGVGAALLARMYGIIRALRLGDVYLFTEALAPYFALRGWIPLESARCNGHPVTIMRASRLILGR